MEEVLSRNLVGQDEAISVISKCIRLSRAGLRYHDRPLGVFLMIGPTVRPPPSCRYPLCSLCSHHW
jgi:ATP-dependent Clp protease ATP-binding subunit ClpA